MSQNQTNIAETKTAFHLVPVLGVTLIVLVAFSVWIYASRTSTPPIGQVELDSHFDLADKNKDGNVTKEEFRSYLEARRAAASDRNAYRSVSNAKTCPSTGSPCSGDGGECCGDCDEQAGAIGGCCQEKSESSSQGGCCQIDGGECDGRCGN